MLQIIAISKWNIWQPLFHYLKKPKTCLSELNDDGQTVN